MGRSRSLFSYPRGGLESGDSRVRTGWCVLTLGKHDHLQEFQRELSETHSEKRPAVPSAMGRHHSLSRIAAAATLVATNERSRLASDRCPGRPGDRSASTVTGDAN